MREVGWLYVIKDFGKKNICKVGYTKIIPNYYIKQSQIKNKGCFVVFQALVFQDEFEESKWMKQIFEQFRGYIIDEQKGYFSCSPYDIAQFIRNKDDFRFTLSRSKFSEINRNNDPDFGSSLTWFYVYRINGKWSCKTTANYTFPDKIPNLAYCALVDLKKNKIKHYKENILDWICERNNGLIEIAYMDGEAYTIEYDFFKLRTQVENDLIQQAKDEYLLTVYDQTMSEKNLEINDVMSRNAAYYEVIKEKQNKIFANNQKVIKLDNKFRKISDSKLFIFFILGVIIAIILLVLGVAGYIWISDSKWYLFPLFLMMCVNAIAYILFWLFLIVATPIFLISFVVEFIAKRQNVNLFPEINGLLKKMDCCICGIGDNLDYNIKEISKLDDIFQKYYSLNKKALFLEQKNLIICRYCSSQNIDREMNDYIHNYLSTVDLDEITRSKFKI